MMILPVDLAKAIHALHSTLIELGKFDSSKQAGLALTKAEMAVYEAARKWAGVEPLTKDMLEAFGKHT
jgi:hypothetical protein